MSEDMKDKILKAKESLAKKDVKIAEVKGERTALGFAKEDETIAKGKGKTEKDEKIAEGKVGKTALEVAMEVTSEEMIKMLIEKGADINR